MKKKILISLIVVMVLILGYVITKSQPVSAPESSNKQADKGANDAKQEQQANNLNNNKESKSMGLEIKTTQEGTGDRIVKSGDVISVHYTGKLTDGTKFDSSVDRGTPFEFQIGQGMVIQGWEQGLLGMKVGEKRTLTIPSDLGYGSRGAGNVIPPNATLIFDVELISIK